MPHRLGALDTKARGVPKSSDRWFRKLRKFGTVYILMRLVESTGLTVGVLSLLSRYRVVFLRPPNTVSMFVPRKYPSPCLPTTPLQHAFQVLLRRQFEFIYVSTQMLHLTERALTSSISVNIPKCLLPTRGTNGVLKSLMDLACPLTEQGRLEL